MTKYDPEFLEILKAYSIHICKPGFLKSDVKAGSTMFDQIAEDTDDIADANEGEGCKKATTRD